MKYVLIATSILLSTVANAQQPSTPVPVQPNEYVLKVTPAEIDIISDGLQTQPFGKVSPLMLKLRQQIIDQQKQADKVEEKKE